MTDRPGRPLYAGRNSWPLEQDIRVEFVIPAFIKELTRWSDFNEAQEITFVFETVDREFERVSVIGVHGMVDLAIEKIMQHLLYFEDLKTQITSVGYPLNVDSMKQLCHLSDPTPMKRIARGRSKSQRRAPLPTAPNGDPKPMNKNASGRSKSKKRAPLPVPKVPNLRDVIVTNLDDFPEPPCSLAESMIGHFVPDTPKLPKNNSSPELQQATSPNMAPLAGFQMPNTNVPPPMVLPAPAFKPLLPTPAPRSVVTPEPLSGNQEMVKVKQPLPQTTFKIIATTLDGNVPLVSPANTGVAVTVSGNVSYRTVSRVIAKHADNFPIEYDLWIKHNDIWTKIPHPAPAYNDSAIWEEYLHKQNKESRDLYLVPAPIADTSLEDAKEDSQELVNKLLLEQETNSQQLALLVEENKELEKHLNGRIENENLLRKELDAYKALVKKNDKVMRGVMTCLTCQKAEAGGKLVFCGACGEFTSCENCLNPTAGIMTCPGCGGLWLWSSKLKGHMGKLTDVLSEYVFEA